MTEHGSRRMTRRSVLKMGAVGIVPVLQSCDNLIRILTPTKQEPIPVVEKNPPTIVVPVKEETSAPTVTPIVTKENVAPQPVLTETPKEEEKTLQERWGGIWEIGSGASTGGENPRPVENKKRKEQFVSRVTAETEALVGPLSNTSLFIRFSPRLEWDENGKPVKTTGKYWGYSAYVVGDNQIGTYYVSEADEGEEIKFLPVVAFKPSESIWGVNCVEPVVDNVYSFSYSGIVGDRKFGLERNVYNTDDPKLLIPLNQNGDVLKVLPLAGYLLSAKAYGGEEQPYFLFGVDLEKMPVLPEGKIRFDFDHYYPEFDLASGRINVWKNEDDSYVGCYDFQTGEWGGEKGYENEGIVWVDKQPEKLTSAPSPDKRGRLPVSPQDYTLSCEAASAENTINWYNETVAGGKIAIPDGYKNFEDFFIAEAGKADNPVEGFCGDIEGGLSVNCDASSGQGYGVYNEPLLNGFKKLGVPAEAITIKDIVAGKEQLRQTLIDSYNNNQVLCLWGRWDDGTHPIEWRTNPRTGEQYPMAYGEHCVAGQVISVDGNSIMIEISDPLPYGTGSRRVYTFNTLANWMGSMGWYMALLVGVLKLTYKIG